MISKPFFFYNNNMKKLLTCLFILSIPILATGKVAVIKSKGFTSYGEILRGFKTICKNGYQEFDLTTKEPSQIVKEIRNGGFSCVLIVGKQATDKISQNLKGIPVVCAGIFSTYLPKGKKFSSAFYNIPIKDQFAFIQKAMPTCKSIAVIFDASSTYELVMSADKIAKNMGLKLEKIKVKNVKGMRTALYVAKENDILWMIPDQTSSSPGAFKLALLTSLKEKLPIYGLDATYVKSGALFGLSADPTENGKLAGKIVNTILKGGKGTSKYTKNPKIVINKKTAQKLGISLPESVIKKAAIVYE